MCVVTVSAFFSSFARFFFCRRLETNVLADPVRLTIRKGVLFRVAERKGHAAPSLLESVAASG